MPRYLNDWDGWRFCPAEVRNLGVYVKVGRKNLEFKKGRASKDVRDVIGVDEGGFSPETGWCRHLKISASRMCDSVTSVL